MRVNILRAMLPLFFLTGVFCQAGGQILYNNGALLFVSSAATVQVNGDAVTAASGTTHNNGDVTIAGSYTNNAVTQGDGFYRVSGNWINNSPGFDCDLSTVLLNGASQQITGTNESQFYNLTLGGSGIKSTTLNSYVLGILALNDRELATAGFTMYVVNTDASAITRTSGFVSSTAGGALSRTTQAASVYLFPVGSSTGTPRYRPVEISPASASQNTFTVRMANVDAGTEGYDITATDSTICQINNLYYHRIMRTSGNDAMTLGIFFDAATDGNWNRISQWTTLGNFWKYTAPAVVSPGILSRISITGWSNYSTDPYILTTRKADAGIYPENPVCQSELPFTLNAVDSGGTWSGTGITNPATGLFSPLAAGPGLIQVIYNIPGLCGDADTAFIRVWANPSLGYAAHEPSCIGANDGSIETFVAGGTPPLTYSWSTGSTDSFLSQITAGLYSVQLTDANGCTGTQSFEVSDAVIECSVDNIFIPNIFSPNGDGQNDVLFVRGTSIKNLKFAVYDRWGEKVFETTEKSNGWNGELRGKPMDQGVFVYYAVVELFDGTVKKLKGNVTLVR